MKKNTIVQAIAFSMALAASGASMADTQFYGAISYGNSVTTGDDEIPYSAFDVADVGDFAVISAPYGNSIYSDIKLGVRFGGNMFVELAGSQTRFDGSAIEGNGGTNVCNTAPTAGLITDCFDDATLNFDSKVKNLDLVFGWTFAPKATWKLEPYVGLREVKLNDDRNVKYLYNEFTGGFNDRIIDNTSFKKVGFLAGVRAEKDLGQVYLSGEFNYSYASGSRTRLIEDTEYQNATTTQFETATYSDDISVRQWNARVAVGHRFAVSENNKMSLSIGYKVGRLNGFDTTNTNSDEFAAGSLGTSNTSLSSRGFDVMLGWNF